MTIEIRAATAADEDTLWMALSQAASEEGTTDARAADHEVRHYLEGWGRDGDDAVVAIDAETEEVVGAAWLRLMPADDPGYGFVEADIPELGIGILDEYRGQGIGGRLMDAILEIATAKHRAVSLSTLDTNTIAQKLYESRGFERVAHEDGAYTMLLEF